MLSVDSKILKDFADHLMEVHNYPPLVSKICAYMHFDFEGKGITFDELLNYFDVSKSSVSCALKYLEDQNHIYFTIRNDCRKRYFHLNQNFVIVKYKQIFDSLSNEKLILKNIIKYKSSLGLEENNVDHKINTVIDIIERNTANLQEAILALTLINNNLVEDEKNL